MGYTDNLLTTMMLNMARIIAEMQTSGQRVAARDKYLVHVRDMSAEEEEAFNRAISRFAMNMQQ